MLMPATSGTGRPFGGPAERPSPDSFPCSEVAPLDPFSVSSAHVTSKRLSASATSPRSPPSVFVVWPWPRAHPPTQMHENLFNLRLFGLLRFLNATQHIFIDIHTTSAPLSRGKLFDGACDPAGPGLRLLGRFDPVDPIATTHGREVVPQRLRLVRSGKGDPEIGRDSRFRLWSQDSEFHCVARVSTNALEHGLVHTQPVGSERVGFQYRSERMTVDGA